MAVVPPSTGFYEEDIIPDGHHEIIFHLDTHSAKRKSLQNNWSYEPDAFFAGQTLQSYALQLKPGAILYGIRFYPHTLALLFGVPAALLTDHLLPLSDMPGATALRHCVSDSAALTFSRFEKILAEQVARLRPSNSFSYVDAAVAGILQHKGNIRIDTLIQRTGISTKHLDNSFKKFVGVTPKTLCNIVRLNHFIRYREQHLSKSLTECAYEAEFYDQSHLIKLFRTFTGQSPKAYFSNTHYINEHFTAM